MILLLLLTVRFAIDFIFNFILFCFRDKIDVPPMIEVDDMLAAKDKPDPKCVFTYMQAVYRKLHDKD